MRIRFLTLALVGATLTAASGCASLPADGRGVAAHRSKWDTEVIAYVENHAKREGTRVVWVNPPRKKAETSN
jgi:hypothetical protein